MSDEEKLGFQVVDKRQFDQAGQPRDNANVDTVEMKNVAGSSTEKAGSSTDAGGNEVDFSGFVFGMMHQAVIMLGEAPHPETGQIVENMEIARQTIEILAMLEEKTKGNLTDEEGRLLRDGVTGLRMAYVAKMREKHS